jgi:hypothetical protein
MSVLILFFHVAEQDAEEEKMQEILGMAFNHKRFVAFFFLPLENYYVLSFITNFLPNAHMIGCFAFAFALFSRIPIRAIYPFHCLNRRVLRRLPALSTDRHER